MQTNDKDTSAAQSALHHSLADAVVRLAFLEVVANSVSGAQAQHTGGAKGRLVSFFQYVEAEFEARMGRVQVS